jgi:asparagine synthetase B (glutamine-hydrolysing)
LYRHYGLSFLSYLRGEFALVLWDARRKVLIAARDRFGVKSLYHTVINNRLIVATEMKCFKAFGWEPEWDVQSFREYSWTYGSGTFFKDVKTVGRCLIVSIRVLSVSRFNQGTTSSAEALETSRMVYSGTPNIPTRYKVSGHTCWPDI